MSFSLSICLVLVLLDLFFLWFSGGLFYTIFRELFSSSSPNKIYGKALEKCRSHPEVSLQDWVTQTLTIGRKKRWGNRGSGGQKSHSGSETGEIYVIINRSGWVVIVSLALCLLLEMLWFMGSTQRSIQGHFNSNCKSLDYTSILNSCSKCPVFLKTWFMTSWS